jgi:hypothetical protein
MKVWALILLAHFPISPTETRVESRQTGGIQLVPELYATQALCETARAQSNEIGKKLLKAGEWYDCVAVEVATN